MTQKILLIISLILVFIFSHACGTQSPQEWREPLNLDFEKATPEGWTMAGEGFEIQLDKTDAAGGKQSLRFQCAGEPSRVFPSFASCRLPVERFRGKRVRYSASLKTRDAESRFFIWLRADKGIDPLEARDMSEETGDIFSNEGLKGPKGTTEWKRFTIEMDVPKETTDLYLGASLAGKGTAWLDEAAIEILPGQGKEIVTIAGTVTDPKGTPVGNATVHLTHKFNERAQAVTASDANGKFRFSQHRGMYFLSASAPGLTAVSISPRHFGRDVPDLEFKLEGEGIDIKGTVKVDGVKVDGDRKSVPANTYVVIQTMKSRTMRVFYAPVPPDGGFQLKVPEGDYYYASVDTPGVKWESKMVKKEDLAGCTLEVEMLQPAPGEVVSWMKETGIPIKTPVAGNGFDDLQPLKKVIGDARIVGLGESSHGTREIFQMKHRLLEFMVQEMGFTVFAIEGSWADCLAVNRYVLTGEGDPARALTGVGFWTWNTEEILAMIRWMRKYNQDPSHTRKVKFYGMDMQATGTAIRLLTKYISKVDPEYKNQLTEILIPLTDTSAFLNLPKLPKEEQESLATGLTAILHRFDEKKESYASVSSDADWRENHRHARVLQQFSQMALDAQGRYNIRDRSMAENTRWLLEHEPPGTRIVMWAHNGHIQATSFYNGAYLPMGYHLREQLGKEYLVIGFLFNRGTLQALDMTAPMIPRLLRGVPLEPAPADSFGSAMARTGVPVFLLDLRALPAEGIVKDWFDAPHNFRILGAAYMGKWRIGNYQKLTGAFDATIYMDKTSRARPNPMGRRPVYPY
ncbi:MAG: hypothetical protein GY940_02645 [bacterium]|nr:hypothetical protein [bacterium]